jgi:hypothetical protein
MDKKLTLSLNQDIIENAKIYAKSNNISLSKLIESYLATLTRKSKMKSEITPLVKSISGVIELPKEFNEKEAYTDYLLEKYR